MHSRWGAAQEYLAKSEMEKYKQIIINSQIIAIIVMPANVVMDRLFNMQQRVCNRHAKHGISTEVAMIARQGMLSCMDASMVRTALFDWMHLAHTHTHAHIQSI